MNTLSFTIDTMVILWYHIGKYFRLMSRGGYSAKRPSGRRGKPGSRPCRKTWPGSAGVKVNLKMLKKEIETKVAEAQKRARARLLGEKEIDKVISLIKENPEGGIIVADGGAVAKSYSYCAETTKLRVAWFLRKNGVLDYSVSACRDYAREVSYGCGPSVEMKGNREQAWKEINPKKAERLHRIRIHFALRGLPKPPEEIGSVVSRQGDIILARAKRSDFVYFLGTPIGWFRVKYDDARGAKSPWTVLWRLGVRSRKRKWTPEIAEKVAAILTMEVLSR